MGAVCFTERNFLAIQMALLADGFEHGPTLLRVFTAIKNIPAGFQVEFCPGALVHVKQRAIEAGRDHAGG